MSANPVKTEVSTYATIMVTVDLAPDLGDRVRAASQLADRFSAKLIGVAAHEIYLPIYGEDYAAAMTELVEQEMNDAKEALTEAKAQFLKAAGERSDVQWHQAVMQPADFLVKQGRAADLVVVSRRGPDDPDPARMSVAAGEIVMALGRPVIMVPPRTDYLAASRVVIGWKDTREARRALWDAMPFLTRAEDVFLAATGSRANEQGLEQVGEYLRAHGIEATTIVREKPIGTTANELIEIAKSHGADLIVSGAYGRSRAREWVFGGVTHDLLNFSPIPPPMSH